MSDAQGRRVYARAPDRLSDVVLAAAALQRLAHLHADVGVDVWCPLPWTSALELADLPGAVIPFQPSRALWRSALWLRRAGYEEAYLFSPSVEAVLVARLAGIPIRRAVVGRWSSGWLGASAARVRPGAEHRAATLMRVADPDWSEANPPAPRLAVPDRARRHFELLLGGRLQRPVLGIVPGAGVAARRWPEGRYTALAGILAAEVGSVVVFGSSRDGVLVARVAAGAGARGIDLGGRTSLTVMAAGLSACDLVIANDGGALQLAAAVGTPTLGIFGPRRPEQVGPLLGSSRALWRSSLPCAPCGRERCPRRGRGTILPEARDECLQLIGVEAVARAALETLKRVGTASDV